MRTSRTIATLALLLILLSALPALCLPLADVAAPPSACHQHHRPMPAHNCCRTAPSSPAATAATFHEPPLEITAAVRLGSVVPIAARPPVLPFGASEFSSPPPPSVLRI